PRADIGKATRKASCSPAPCRSHERNGSRRIDAAGQKGDERDVGNHLGRDGVGKKRLESRFRIGARTGKRTAEAGGRDFCDVPIFTPGYSPAGHDREILAGKVFGEGAGDRRGRGHMKEAQIAYYEG